MRGAGGAGCDRHVDRFLLAGAEGAHAQEFGADDDLGLVAEQTGFAVR
jgi:hypothetical protein